MLGFRYILITAAFLHFYLDSPTTDFSLPSILIELGSIPMEYLSRVTTDVDLLKRPLESCSIAHGSMELLDSIEIEVTAMRWNRGRHARSNSATASTSAVPAPARSAPTTPRHGRRVLRQSHSFPTRSTSSWAMYTGDYSLPTPTPLCSEASSLEATFQSPVSDGQLAYLIQNRANDPCKVFGDQRNPDKNSPAWNDSKMACEMAFLAYLGIIQQSHNKHQCPDAKDAECRLIMRSSTKIWEWTCTVKVRNHLCGAFLCCELFRVEHLDYCVKTLSPAVMLRSRRYDYNRNMGRSLSSSEGGIPSKPTFIPEED